MLIIVFEYYKFQLCLVYFRRILHLFSHICTHQVCLIDAYIIRNTNGKQYILSAIEVFEIITQDSIPSDSLNPITLPDD